MAFIVSIALLLLPDSAVAGVINGADTAWMLTATALVVMMAPAGLALFYGGQIGRKSVLNTIGMAYTAFCTGFLVWIIAGYSIAFGSTDGLFFGDFSQIMLRNIGVNDVTGTIPTTLFVCFQGAFAGITIAIVAGSVVERVRYSTWLIFCALWTLFCYAPVAHFIWGGGFLSHRGELDFAGGTVVHINAGVAGLVCAAMLGRRQLATSPVRPSSLRITLLGSALLWLGWFGFNAGSALGANSIAAHVILVTNIAACAGGFGWLMAEWLSRSRRTLTGTASGVVCGLVAITPAAGYVGVSEAMLIGLISGVLGYYAVTRSKILSRLDDSLDAFAIHGLIGIFGALATGIFANPDIGSGTGLLYGNPMQVVWQLFAVLAVIAYTTVLTAICFTLASFIARGKRVTVEEEALGMDYSYHGEEGLDMRSDKNKPKN